MRFIDSDSTSCMKTGKSMPMNERGNVIIGSSELHACLGVSRTHIEHFLNHMDWANLT
jgi:hypothetical protein